MQLTPAQSEIARDRHRFRVVNIGRRGGKTTLAIEEMHAKAVAQDDQRIAYVAPTYQQARDIAWEQLKRRLRPVAVSINESRLEITVRTQHGGTSLIVLRGWEAIETLRGQKFHFVVIDEVAMMRNFWIGWHEVIRPALTDTRGEALFISTPKGFNHFYDLYNLEAKDTDYKSFHFTTFDNSLIPREEIEKARQELPESRFAQEYMADFRKQEGLVYKEFDRSKHLFDELTPRRETADIIAGVDFGYTNPSVILKIIHDVDNHYWVTDEWYKPGKTNAELIEVARSLDVNLFYPDPAEPDRIEEMKRAGLNIREVSKDIPKGIDAVRELFKQNRLHIHQRCQNLITELEMYQYPEKRPDKNEPEVPVKEHDHACDALRYALYMNAPVADSYSQSDFNIYGTTYD